MDNGKISLRQCKRLLFFDVLGIGILFLPNQLANGAAKSGGIAIIVGLLASLVMVWAMKAGDYWEDQKTKTFAFSNIGQKMGLLFYGSYFVVLGAYVCYLLAELVQIFLLPKEHFALICALIIALALYSTKIGMEGRSRVFELFYWPMQILLALLLALGVGEVKLWNLAPVRENAKGFLQGAYQSFAAFSIVQLIYFMPQCLEPEVSFADIKKEVRKTLVLAGVVLFCLYEVLLGSFGPKALGDSKVPVMIFSSNLVLPGGFLRRQEALVAGVCFVGALAVVGSSMQYAKVCWKQVKDSKVLSVLVAVIIFFLALWENKNAHEAVELQGIWLCLTPLALLVSALLFGKKKSGAVARKNSLRMLAVLMVSSLFMTGCAMEELEDKSFPMALFLGEEDGAMILDYKYMDLSQVSEKEKTKVGSDELRVKGQSLLGVMSEMDQKNGKRMDMNHAKVILLETSFLENEEFVKQLIKETNQNATISGNLLVLACENIEEISDTQEQMHGDIGSYLEELVEGHPDFKNVESFALKSWVSDWYEENRWTILPRVTVAGGLPVLEGYYGIMHQQDQIYVEELTQVEGLGAGICQSNVDQMDLRMQDGLAHLENLHVEYDFMQSHKRVVCHITFFGDIDDRKSVDLPPIKEVEDYFASLMTKSWETRSHLDITNSFARLAYHDKAIYDQYRDYKSYYDALDLQIDADFTLQNVKR